MRKGYWVAAAMVAALAAPQMARAEEEVTDWKGNKIHLQEGDVDSHGVKIHYYTVGKGPLLIISHGNGDFWFGWRNQFAFLSKRYQVVVYDLRGFNKSDHPTGVQTNANYEQDLLAVQEHFTKGPAIHIGNDQGGMVLWTYAMDHPDKVKLLIESNAIHPRAFVRALAFDPEQQKASWYIQQFIDDPTGKGFEFEKMVMSPERRAKTNPPDIQKMWVDAYKRTTDQGLRNTVDWYRTDFPATPYSPDAKAFNGHGNDFPHVKCPTMVIEALNDPALMPGGYNQLGTWIDAEYSLVTLPDATHFENLDHSDRFNAIVGNWLDVHDPSGSKLTAN